MDWEVSAWPYEEVTLCEIWKIRTATVTSLGEEGWSFTSLLQRARQLARRLHTVAPAPGCVGLGLDEGIPMVLLHVAVLEACSFCPWTFDNRWPALRACWLRQGAAEWLRERMSFLKTSRPTAVNLFNTMDALGKVVEDAVASGRNDQQIYHAYADAAEQMLEEDVKANKAIGDAGADAILAAMKAAGRDGAARVMTICNTGALATAGWGTALGVLRTLHARGKLERAYCLETRPYNQGARLTAFELVEDGLPGTLICDSMAAALMQRYGLDACIVGADRVVANGDSANKIGTYSLAVLSRHHGVPFYVAAPLTTLDVNLKHGSEIPIEERPDEELCSLKVEGVSHRVAAPGIGVWNPAFDVTPASLISGIVTDCGLIPKRSQDFDVAAFVPEKKRKVNGQ